MLFSPRVNFPPIHLNMLSRLISKDAPVPDEGEEQDIKAWPPQFQTYESYKQELEEAIEAHPPFGTWLLAYRNPHHMERDGPAMWSMTVEELKQRYLDCKRPLKIARNAKRMFAEMHLQSLEAKEDIHCTKTNYKEACAAYKTALDAYNSSKRHGYNHYLKPPIQPQKPALIKTWELLSSMCEENVEEKHF